MKSFIFLLTVGMIGSTILYFNRTQDLVVEGSGIRTVKYTGVNNFALDSLKSKIENLQNKLRANQQNDGTVEFEASIRRLNLRINAVYNFLKDADISYHQVYKKSSDSFKTQLAQAQDDITAQVNVFVEKHLASVSQFKTSVQNKNKLIMLLNDIRGPFKAKSQFIQADHLISAQEIIGLKQDAQAIKKPTALTMELHERVPKQNYTAYFVLWGVLIAASAIILKREKKSAPKNQENFESHVNATIKKIISELDQPIFVCDSGFSILWQNEASKKTILDPAIVQTLVTSSQIDLKDEIFLDGKNFKVKVTELSYKSGKKNLFVQLKPLAIPSELTSHLLEPDQVSILLEESSVDLGGFKDFNQTIAELSIKMSYLFQVSGKFLDIDLKKDISDCFVENTRLSTMCREFITSCHHLIKDNEHVNGIYLRTEEIGQRLSLGCFLPTLAENHFKNGNLARELLKKFAMLEAKFSICSPRIEIKHVSSGDLSGMDIVLTFENRSQMESLAKQTFATM